MSERHTDSGRDYANKLRGSGYSDEQIRQKLREAGWTKTQIDELMIAKKQPPKDSSEADGGTKTDRLYK